MIPTGLWELWKPKWSDPTLCADTMKTLLTAVEQLPAAQRPRRLVVISTTGIEEKRNGMTSRFCSVPCTIIFLKYLMKING